MKKITVLLTALVLSASLIGCAKEEATLPTTVDIYNMFVDTGLPVGYYEDYTEETEPNNLMNKENQYISKLSFEITTLDQSTSEYPVGGSIEIFNNKKDAEARKKYIDDIGKEMPMFAESSQIVLDRVLIRIDKQVTATETQKYFDVFK